MSVRYGIIVKQDDGTEVVSNILEKTGGPPVPGSENATVVKDLDPRVKIGMIKGGKGEAAAGFGFNTEVATPPVTGPTDEEVAEAKIAASKARFEAAKGDDDYDARFGAEKSTTKAASKKS